MASFVFNERAKLQVRAIISPVACVCNPSSPDMVKNRKSFTKGTGKVAGLVSAVKHKLGNNSKCMLVHHH